MTERMGYGVRTLEAIEANEVRHKDRSITEPRAQRGDGQLVIAVQPTLHALRFPHPTVRTAVVVGAIKNKKKAEEGTKPPGLARFVEKVVCPTSRPMLAGSVACSITSEHSSQLKGGVARVGAEKVCRHSSRHGNDPREAIRVV